MMTKKDYIAFAKMFKTMLKDVDDMSMDKETVAVAIDRTCEIFENDNSNFDKQRFIEFVNKE